MTVPITSPLKPLWEPVLSGVQAVANPSPGNIPEGSEFTYGLFDFTINGIAAGGETYLTLYLPADARPAMYYKYGRTPDNPTDHWYAFMFDGATGARIDANVVTLYFVDAEKGDDVLTPDGMIIDMGGPLFDTSADEDAQYGPLNEGCFVDSLTLKTSPPEPAGIKFGLGMLLVGFWFAMVRAWTRRRVAAGLLAVGLLMGLSSTGQADESRLRPISARSFYLSAGIGVASIDESVGADYLGSTYRLEVDNIVYPILRGGYHVV